MDNTDWSPSIAWDAPAGQILKTFFAALPHNRHFHITLFGSSPLQLGVDSGFLSGKVDLFADETRELLEQALKETGLAERSRTLYIQLCNESNFRSSPRWVRRAFTTQVGNVTLTLPHPLDILIAKLHRLADKDLAAFRLVIARTGHPTEDELRRELQFAVDLYRPNFDEEMIGDITTNTRVLWQELWGKEINVRAEIIVPAIAARRDGYDFPKMDYKAELRRLGAEWPARSLPFPSPRVGWGNRTRGLYVRRNSPAPLGATIRELAGADPRALCQSGIHHCGLQPQLQAERG